MKLPNRSSSFVFAFSTQESHTLHPDCLLSDICPPWMRFLLPLRTYQVEWSNTRPRHCPTLVEDRSLQGVAGLWSFWRCRGESLSLSLTASRGPTVLGKGPHTPDHWFSHLPSFSDSLASLFYFEESLGSSGLHSEKPKLCPHFKILNFVTTAHPCWHVRGLCAKSFKTDWL